MERRKFTREFGAFARFWFRIVAGGPVPLLDCQSQFHSNEVYPSCSILVCNWLLKRIWGIW